MDRRLRILHIDTERGFRGGERQVSLLAEGLRERKHEQLFIGPAGGSLTPYLASRGFAVAEYHRPLLMGVRSPLLRRWLRRQADGFRPDIVHAHTGNAHTAAVHSFLGSRPLLTTRRVDFAIQNNAFSRAKYTRPGQHYIAISRAIRDILVEGGVAPEAIDVIPSGIDPARVAEGNGAPLRAEWLGGDSGPVIGFIGAFADHKAPWVLAHAAGHIRRALPGAKVVFVGDGELRPRLEEISADLPGSIVFAGWREDVANCLAAFDLFVMPSKLEGLCTSLIDALAAGVPCVAARAGGIPEVIVDGVTGVLVPPLDEEALASAVVDLWHDGARRARFVEAGRRRVAECFTAGAMVEGTLSVYRRMLGLGG